MRSIISLGAESKTTFSVLAGGELFLSNIIEDASRIDGYESLESGLRYYLEIKGIVPDVIVCDLHPDYRTTRKAELLKEEYPGAKVLKVQHHFAHIVSCLYDNGITEKVVGVAFDGTGYGGDGNAWGGEFFTCDRQNYKREYHLEYVSQPGGDVAAQEPWRMALSYLYQAGLDLGESPLAGRISDRNAQGVKKMMEMAVNCPKTSSMGRLFDAVSSLIGICDCSRFEAEAAISLERDIKTGEQGFYGYEINGEEIRMSPMIRKIVKEVKEGVSAGVISARFHNTICNMVKDVAERISERSGIKKVLISGGCFQNRYIVNRLVSMFEGSALELFKHNKYPTTDAGISVGQAAVAESIV